MSVSIERCTIFLVIVVAIGAMWLGVSMAMTTDNPHWINRAGALIVASESLLLLAELSRRTRIRHMEEDFGKKNPYIFLEAARAEKRLIVIGVTMMLIGEMVHGFGDLIFEVVYEFLSKTPGAGSHF